ncbi:HDOD domain-containing protein [uncultured Pseudoteredinibacter sp.]|uniref:HDOD domain-containing protein n=1 Tax=uncultured Pseudoteredinibacter sp. TaxID=1641701 RepID=UPI00260B2FE1|nr:HDOD domain-containing protein [uncultured Pseudoteredinibacter sp.]
MSSEIELSELRRFEPFDSMSEDQLSIVCNHSQRRVLRSGEVVFCAGDRDAQDYFLLKGQLQLVSNDQKSRVFSDEDPMAYRQVSKLRPRQYTVSAMGAVELLVVKSFDYDSPKSKSMDSPDYLEASLLDYGVDEVSEESQGDIDLFREVQAALESDDLKLPSLPQVAIRIGELVESDLASAESVADLVNTDPAIAAKLLRIANSSLYGSLGRCETTRDAIVRLGLGATRQLVMGFALRDLFNSDDKALRAKLRQSWIESLEVAALAMVIREMLIAPTYSSEEALLAGLLHDIGVVGLLGLFLAQPGLLKEDADIDGLIAEFKADVGAEILRKWQIADQYISVTEQAENWQRTHSASADLCDLIQVAILHRYLNNRVPLPMARLTEVPAIKRLPLKESYSPETSLEILKQAKEKILEIKGLFD